MQVDRWIKGVLKSQLSQKMRQPAQLYAGCTRGCLNKASAYAINKVSF